MKTKVNLWMLDFYSIEEFDISKCYISDTSYKPSGYFLAAEGLVEVTNMVSKDDAVKSMVESLNNQKKSIMADHQMQINRIDERINQLLAIEDKS
jgi:hypothetical protein